MKTQSGIPKIYRNLCIDVYVVGDRKSGLLCEKNSLIESDALMYRKTKDDILHMKSKGFRQVYSSTREVLVSEVRF